MMYESPRSALLARALYCVLSARWERQRGNLRLAGDKLRAAAAYRWLALGHSPEAERRTYARRRIDRGCTGNPYVGQDERRADRRGRNA